MAHDMGLLGDIGGLRIFVSELCTEAEEYEVVVQLSFRQRWIEPLLHGITMPFEPWVKTRTETRRRNVPLKKVIQTPQGLLMHPAMKDELLRALL